MFGGQQQVTTAARRGSDRAARTSSPKCSRILKTSSTRARSHPHRPQRLRDRQELPGRSGAGERPEADARRRWRTLDGEPPATARSRRPHATSSSPAAAPTSRAAAAARPGPRGARRSAAARLALHGGAGEALPGDVDDLRRGADDLAGRRRATCRRCCRITSSRRAAARSASASPARSALKLAHPDKTVDRLHRRRRQHVHHPGAVDGGAPRIGAKFVICNNALHAAQAEHPAILEETRACRRVLSRLLRPADPVHPIRSAGRVDGGQGRPGRAADEVGPALDAAFAHDGPFLIDLVVSNEVAHDVAHAKHLRAGQS